VDIAMKTGTVLQSMEDGVVEKVSGGYSGGASRFDGYQVTIRFRNGNRAFYTHLSKAGVKPGQKIRAGQAIGRSGAANGVEHLHLGVEKGDPRDLLKKAR
jgi:murein DD-endopeptidase MepM/ murein hydrolase activator NlpD